MSGPNALVDLVCFKTLRSSGMVNSEVGISKVSAIFSLGSEILSGNFGSLPKRFPKCLAQLATSLNHYFLVLLQDQYFRARHKPQALPSIGLVD